MSNITIRNNVNVIGNGEQTIIFAHGFGCDQNMWKYIVPSFKENYQIVLFDYVGSGSSDKSAYVSDKYNTLQGYVQDLLDIIEHLRLRNIIFIGHSVSSMIGMLASIRKPNYFSNLIMVGPSPCYLNTDNYSGGFEKSDIQELLEMMEMNFSGWASSMAPLAMNNPESPELTEELKQSFVAANPIILREFAEVTFFSDYRNDLARSTVPTLILQCSDDSIVPIEVGEYLHQHLPNSTLCLLKARGHYPHISQPEETVNAIKTYLVSN